MTTRAASLTRRTKKTIPKPLTDVYPAPSPRVDEDEEEEKRENLAYGMPAAPDGGRDEGCVSDREDPMLLESSDNYRRYV